MRTIVVGAGLGGLSAACHLRGRGHDVVVLERGSVPGGRAGSLEAGGYRFDTGPTVLTMPELIRDCFGAGMWYPEGFEKGVARCEHKSLRKKDT